MPTFTLATLRSLVLDRLDQNVTLYTLPEVDYSINESIRTTALFTGFFRTTIQLPGYTQPNVLVYQTPAPIMAPMFLTFEGRQLQKVSLRKLARLRRNWATATTTSYGQVDYWAPLGIGQFVINPIDPTGGHDLTITGLGEPPLLVNPTDVMVIENEYVDVITDYCAHRLPLKVGGKLFADGSLTLNDFYAKVKERLRYTQFVMPKYWLLGQRFGQPAEGATTGVQP
jgi:hypothetical protein